MVLNPVQETTPRTREASLYYQKLRTEEEEALFRLRRHNTLCVLP